MQSLVSDLRYAIRSLLKSPGFACTAVLTLAIGIGSTTAIFSVVYSVLLKPLPYPDSERLYALGELRPSFGELPLAYPDYLDWRANQHSFEDISVYRRDTFNLAANSRPEHLTGAFVSASYFQVLGLKPELGRTFEKRNDLLGSPYLVVLSDSLWRHRFGADPKIIGRTLVLNDLSYEVVGVAPKDLTDPGQVDVYVSFGPFADSQYLKLRDSHVGLHGIGRLKPGVSSAQAAADLNLICQNLAQRYPDTNSGERATLRPLLERSVSDYQSTLWLLFGVVGIVLLIACANVAGLLLARGVDRRDEIAVRSALGASRSRIIFQMLTESVVLAVLGGGVGLLFTLWSIDAIVALCPPDLPRLDQIGVNGSILGFALLVSAGTGILFGLLPALKASRTDANATLKEGDSRGSAGRGRFHSQRILVIAQVALTTVLLFGSGLLIQSFQALQTSSLGFDPHQMLSAQIKIAGLKYENVSIDSARSVELVGVFNRMLDSIRSVPGVRTAALTTITPFSNEDDEELFTIPGRPPPKAGEEPLSSFKSVTPDFFSTMQVPILRGRSFNDEDDLSKPRVIIVDQDFVNRFFPNQDPIGQKISFFDDSRPNASATIVGIVPRVIQDKIGTEPSICQMYCPLAQDPDLVIGLLLRVDGNPLSYTDSVKKAVASVDSGLPIFNVRTMDTAIAASLETQHLSVVLVGLFAVVSLLLASIGLYGLLAYSVVIRTREIGIRLALGAQRESVARLVVSEAMTLVGTGLVLGLSLAFVFGRLLTAVFLRVAPSDFGILFIVVAVLGFTGLIAGYLPARRAIGIDPIKALRE
jgi:predicted permease